MRLAAVAAGIIMCENYGSLSSLLQSYHITSHHIISLGSSDGLTYECTRTLLRSLQDLRYGLGTRHLSHSQGSFSASPGAEDSLEDPKSFKFHAKVCGVELQYIMKREEMWSSPRKVGGGEGRGEERGEEQAREPEPGSRRRYEMHAWPVSAFLSLAFSLRVSRGLSSSPLHLASSPPAPSPPLASPLSTQHPSSPFPTSLTKRGTDTPDASSSAPLAPIHPRACSSSLLQRLHFASPRLVSLRSGPRRDASPPSFLPSFLSLLPPTHPRLSPIP